MTTMPGDQLSLKLRRLSTTMVDSRLVEIALLLAITGLAALLRFYKLGEWSFWIDEIFTINRVQAHYGSLSEAFQNLPPNFFWTPISLLLTSGSLSLFGVSEWSARLVPALIGILSIPLIYIPVKRIFGPGIALISALLLAISPWHLYWSQNARFYTMLMLLFVLALLAFYFAFEQDKWWLIIVFWVFFYLSASERLLAIFLIPVVVIYLPLLLLSRDKIPPGFNRRNLALVFLPIAAVVTVEVISIIVLGESVTEGYLEWFLLHRSDDPLRLAFFIASGIGIPLLVLALFGGLRLVYRANRAGTLLFLGAFIPILMLITLNPFLFTKDRYVFVTLPSCVILAATTVKGLFDLETARPKLLALGVLSLLVADAAADNLMYYRVNNGSRRDWRGAFSLIEENGADDDLVVMFWPELGQYYLGEQREILPWRDIDIDEVATSDRRVWFVIDSETQYANREGLRWLQREAELINIHYLRTVDDFSLHLYLFDPGES